MPSKSKDQAKLMRAAANTPGGYGGVPQSVGKDFEAADEAKARKRTTKDMIKKRYGKE